VSSVSTLNRSFILMLRCCRLDLRATCTADDEAGNGGLSELDAKRDARGTGRDETERND
jgi:hypothetical protein